MVSFLSNLNVTVLSVHCGRTHTLLLTNNGVSCWIFSDRHNKTRLLLQLYAMGANHLGQLGIGPHLSQSLHPVLVRQFIGKNITQITSGQYHNAVIADGDLYTWGWGVYGQLGNGSIEDVQVPQKVPFFRKKVKIQLSF